MHSNHAGREPSKPFEYNFNVFKWTRQDKESGSSPVNLFPEIFNSANFVLQLKTLGIAPESLLKDKSSSLILDQLLNTFGCIDPEKALDDRETYSKFVNALKVNGISPLIAFNVRNKLLHSFKESKSSLSFPTHPKPEKLISYTVEYLESGDIGAADTPS